MARELVVLLWGSVILDRCPVAAGHAQGTEGNANIAKLAPELTPAVPDNPVLALACIVSPANDRDNMINTTIAVFHNTGLVVEERISCDATGNRTTVVNLLLHGAGTTDGAIIINADVGVVAQSSARAAFTTETAAGASSVQSTAFGVDMATETFRRIT